MHLSSVTFSNDPKLTTIGNSSLDSIALEPDEIPSSVEIIL